MGLLSKGWGIVHRGWNALTNPGGGAQDRAAADAQKATAAALANLAFQKDVYKDKKKLFDEAHEDYMSYLTNEMVHNDLRKDDLFNIVDAFTKDASGDVKKFSDSIDKLAGRDKDFNLVYLDAYKNYVETQKNVHDNYKDLDQATAQFTMAQTAEFNKWTEMFGSPMDNLRNYYDNLNADDFAATGKAHLSREFKMVNDSITKTMSQRGVLHSGMYDEATLSGAAQLAQARASIDIHAKETVNNKLQQYLTWGKQLQPKANQIMQALMTNAGVQAGAGRADLGIMGTADNRNKWMTGLLGDKSNANLGMISNAISTEMNTSGRNAMLPLLTGATQSSAQAAAGVSQGWAGIANAWRNSMANNQAQAAQSQNYMSNIWSTIGGAAGTYFGGQASGTGGGFNFAGPLPAQGGIR